MLQILTKNNFITDTIFSDICSENIFENEIKKFDNIAKGLFDNSSETNSSNIKFKFIELNKVAKFVFAELKTNNLTDQNFFLYINELEQLFRLELEQYEDFFLKRLSYEKKIEKNILHDKKFFFNKLKLETLNKILNIANKYKEKFEINISKKLNSRKDLSINTGKDIRKIIKILNDEFDQNGVNNIVSNYVKKEFKVIGCAIELSTPDSTWWKQNKNKKLSSKTIYAHIDQSLICPKSICYLTDVKIENGPTSFYPNIYEDLKLNFFQNIFGRINLSVAQDKKSKLYKIYNKKSNRLDESSEQLRHLKKIPRNIFFDSHLGWYIKKNTELEKKFLQKEKFMLGEKGLYVVFDGSKLFHRGGCIKKNKRLVLQITFGEQISTFHKIIKKIRNITFYK